jgi:hypothetical protein
MFSTSLPPALTLVSLLGVLYLEEQGVEKNIWTEER